MRGFARALGIVGWLWFITGFVGPMFGFDLFNIFPGLVLIFISRMMARAARTRIPEEAEESPAPERVLNTDRPTPPPPRPEPVVRHHQPEPQPRPETEPVRDDILNRILLAGREAEDETVVHEEASPPDEGTTPRTSAEMIAQARKRWDRRG
jgi:hypothetical protein